MPDIFKRHHGHHRPEDEAQHAIDMNMVSAADARQRFQGSVDRAGADIAIDDADRRDQQLVQRTHGFGDPVRHREQLPDCQLSVT